MTSSFSVSVDWGDGQSGDTKNGGQPFYFAAGSSSSPFSVSHRFMLDSTAGQVNVDSANHWATASESYQIGVTVFPTDSSDGRQCRAARASRSSTRARRSCLPTRRGSTPGDDSSLCTATASAYESWNPNAGITYQWIVNEGWGGEQRVGDDATCPNLSFD